MIPGIDREVQIVVIWGLAILAIAWTWVPALIASLGGTRYLSGGSNELQGLDPSPNEPDYAFWVAQLRPLGYEPLGAGWARVHFAAHEWMLFTPMRFFINRSKHTYAMLQKAPAPFFFWPGVVFVSSFTDDSLLTTSNNLAANPDPGDDYIRQGVVSLNLAEVEELHTATLEALRSRKGRPEPDMSVEALLHATDRYFAPEAKKTHGRAGTQYLFAHGLIHICVSTPMAYLLGIGHPSVGIANLVLALLLLFGESSHKRQFARAVRSAMRARQAQAQREAETET